MPLSTNDYSRFKETQTILFNGVETFGKWTPPAILKRDLPDEDIQFFVVDNSTQGRPDLIANEVYGTTFLDWLVIAFNKPRSTLNWPRTGDVIKLPIQSVALAELT
jgi:hypothetical protein